MADQHWRSDPTVQQYVQRLAAFGQPSARDRATGVTREREQVASALRTYVDQNRTWLGVPQGYNLNFQGELIDNSRPWWEIPAVAGSMLAGAYGIGALAGEGGASAASAAGGALPNSGASLIPAASASVPQAVAGTASAGVPFAAGTTAAGLLPNTGDALIPAASRSVPQAATSAASAATAHNGQSLLQQLLGDHNRLGNAAALGLGGLNAVNSLRQPAANDDLKKMLGLAEDRVNSSKPLFDALQTMALAGMPTYAKGGQ